MAYTRIANGLNVHYDISGIGPDVAMIHGLFGHLGNWHFKIVPQLWDDFRLLTYDIRGHGYTELTEVGYTPTQLATDLKLLMDDLDIEKADIVGHSFGADIGFYFAFLFPERTRKAILIEPLVPALTPILTREDFEGKQWLANALDKMGVPVPEERQLDTEYMLSQVFEVPNVRWGPSKGMPRTKKHRDWLIRLCTTTSLLKDAVTIDDLTVEAIPTIEVPVHLIYDSSALMWHRSYEYLRDHLPNATSVVLKSGPDDIPHFSPLEKPDLVAQLILEGLKGTPAASQA